MKKTYVYIIAVIVLVLGGGYLVWNSYNDKASVAVDTYINQKYGISFSYPVTFYLNELTQTSVSHAGNIVHHFTLTRKSDANSISPINGEGPTVVTLDIYENVKDPINVKGWIENNDESNYSIRKGDMMPTKVADNDMAYEYAWSGLYEGRSTVFSYANNILVLSETHFDNDDPTITAYENILKTFDFGVARPK